METTKPTNVNWLWWLFIVIFLIILMLLQQCENQKDKEAFIELQNAMNDTVHHFITEDGKKAGRIALMESQDINDFLKLKSQDSTIISLQKLVTKYKSQLNDRGVAGVFDIETNINSSTPTIVSGTKTINDTIFPTYTTKLNMRGWIYGDVIANRDSIQVGITVKNSFDVVVGQEKTGFLGLGKPKPFADLILNNPFSEVKSMRVYQKDKASAKNLYIGPVVGWGVSSEFKPVWFGGVGIMYTPFSF